MHAAEGNGRSDSRAMSDSEAEDDQLDPALACPVCHGVYKSPVSASCCGNSFCKACLEEALMVRDCCPMCRTPLVGSTIDTITPNRALESFIETVRRSGVLQQKNKGGKVGKEEKNLMHRVLCRFSTWSVCVRFCNFVGGKKGLEVLRYTRQRLHLPRQSLETIRCLFYIALVCLVIVFLRVNEQDWASRQKYLAARPESLNMVGESDTT